MSLTLYVIYNNPSDYPGKFVVRRWIGLQACAEPEGVFATLNKARGILPIGSVSVSPQEYDDPCIAEVWI